MKKFLKTLAVFAAVVALGFGFASCADDDDDSGSGSALVAYSSTDSDGSSDVWSKIIKNHQFKLSARSS